MSGVKLGSGTRFNIRNPRISAREDLRILRRRGGSGQEFLGGGGQGPQKGNVVGIFIPTSKIKKLGGGLNPWIRHWI